MFMFINNFSRHLRLRLVLKFPPGAQALLPPWVGSRLALGGPWAAEWAGVRRAPGPDGLSARVLKECSSEIAPILAFVCGGSLAQGTVPDDWRRADVAPVCGGGERCGAANYRPVSLACVCCKTLEHIIVSNINKHLSLENILAGCRRGFRGRRSCGARLVRFFHDMVGDLDRARGRGRGQADVVVVGFAEAFGGVPHGGLLYNCNTTGLEDLLTSGSLHGSLSAIKKWC